MAQWLDNQSADFPDRFSELLGAKRESAADVNAAVADIIAEVRDGGDASVAALTAKFDHHDVDAAALRFSDKEIDAAVAECPADIREALEFAAGRIAAYHEQQRPDDARYSDEAGVEMGHRWTAVQSAGLYVPGGSAAYPSSVLMNAIPATVAGVERLVMVVPTPHGVVNAQVLTAARIAGVTEIYRIGGAQAVAALAYGTESIEPVAKIVGPGNAYVAAAKRQVFGTVGIDMIAGPSEVLIVADKENDPDWIAADLLAQAEHDANAQSILVTDDEAFAGQVEIAVDRQLKTLPRAEIAGASWRDFGTIIIVDKLENAMGIVDKLAPEHLEIAANIAETLVQKVTNAGAIFIGAHTPEAVGDYVGGPNHVLPTARSARFSSGLNVLDFMKRTSILKCSPDALREIGPAAITLGRAEGLEAHARSVALRLNLP
jgi:histidinol dehydrogenase